MGVGDELISTALARGAKARGKRIALGDGRRIIWGPYCAEMFRGNPNIAPPGSEGAHDLEWVEHYKGKRIYVNTQTKRQWVFNKNFKIAPGEVYFEDHEKTFANSISPGFILIEPRVKPVYPNKQWPVGRYAAVAKKLINHDHRVAQFVYAAKGSVQSFDSLGAGTDQILCSGIEPIRTANFRLALAVLSRAALFIGPEGALAHGAAAVGVPSVVIFGGFTDPAVVGYDGNINLTGGVKPCGHVNRCAHCMQAMNAISVDDVFSSARKFLVPAMKAAS